MGLILKKTKDVRNPFDLVDITIEIDNPEAMSAEEIWNEIKKFLRAAGIEEEISCKETQKKAC